MQEDKPDIQETQEDTELKNIILKNQIKKESDSNEIILNQIRENKFQMWQKRAQINDAKQKISKLEREIRQLQEKNLNLANLPTKPTTINIINWPEKRPKTQVKI